MQDGGPITAISFRSDGEALMASSNTLGTIALWDLEKKSLHAMIPDAHDGTINALAFLATQPLLVSVGACNSVKVWAFDATDNGARILRYREGHSAPPTKIRYYGDDGRVILSAAQDRSLRSFNVFSDARTHELSQGSVMKKSLRLGLKAEQLKLSPIVDFASESTRERDWDNIVTCHLNGPAARTWTNENKKIGKHRLAGPKGGPSGLPKCVDVSPCGNFAVVGYTDGQVRKFNMQSGMCRGFFGKAAAHKRAVRGVACDALNQFVVTASEDQFLKVWNFGKHGLVWRENLGTPLLQVAMHRESGLVAVAGGDFVVRVVDIEAKRVVRVFAGHDNRLTDVSWSPDARWLVSGSMDATVRVWDVPTGCLLWQFAVPRPATSLSFSATGDFLATTHVGSVGIYLWANLTMYEETSLQPQDGPAEVLMPASRAGNAPSTQAAATEADRLSEAEFNASFPAEVEPDDEPSANKEASASPLGDGMITLSSIPKSRWANLSNLAEIKRRNKPLEPPKAPKSAPFFIPTVAGLKTQFAMLEDPLDAENRVGSGSRLLNFGKIGAVSAFQKQLLQADCDAGCVAMMVMLKSMGPASIDLEIRSLGLEDDGAQLRTFLGFIRHHLATKQDFELAQSYLNLFLQVHGDVLSGSDSFAVDLKATLDEQDLCWNHLDALFQHSLCAIVSRNPGVSLSAVCASSRPCFGRGLACFFL